jgi:hypothetical protein
MKCTKILAAAFLIFSFCLPIAGEKRAAPKSMKELTDSKSRYYVPYPYPKNRKEIIANLYYFIEKRCKLRTHLTSIDQRVPLADSLLVELLKLKPIYKVGKIFKVKNRNADLTHDYIWLVLVMDRHNEIVVRAAMATSGVMVSYSPVGFASYERAVHGGCINLDRILKPQTVDDVKRFLSDSLGYTVKNHEVKKIERVAYTSSRLGNLLVPVWEIKMADGSIFYYSECRDAVYSIDKKIHYKEDNSGKTPYLLVSRHGLDYLIDTIDDVGILLNKMPRKRSK